MIRGIVRLAASLVMAATTVVKERVMDAFIEAQIATVKELLAEAKAAGDALGEYSMASRLAQLEKEAE